MKFFQILILALLVTFLSTCNLFKWNLDQKPNIILFEIESIQNESVIIDYEIESSGSPFESIFCNLYNDTTSDAIMTIELINMHGEILAQGLLPNTTFWARLTCTNNAGTISSDYTEFTTGPSGGNGGEENNPPSLNTLNASSITTSSAILNGEIVSPGSSPIDSRGFCFSTSNNPDLNSTVVYVNPGNGLFNKIIYNLNSNTTYFYKAFASNSSGMALGNLKSFQTGSPTPNLNIGDSYGGGTVGYIYEPGDDGYISGETHGIILSYLSFLDLEFGPYSEQSTNFGANLNGLGSDGEDNTNVLTTVPNNIYHLGNTGAAKICNNLILNGFSDWYLPSIGELQVIFNNQFLSGVLGTPGNTHWSSTEDNSSNSFCYDSYFLGTVSSSKQNGAYILPIRRF